MRHPSPVHSPAEYIAITGSQTGERPSLGSWINYGLGSENQDLPGFYVFSDWHRSGRAQQTPGLEQWLSAGSLPGRANQRQLDSESQAARRDATDADRRAQLDLLGQLNRRHFERHSEMSELDARIRNFEMAYRMLAAAPGLFDLAQETAETKSLYGLDQKETAEFGTNCLLARRMIESAVCVSCSFGWPSGMHTATWSTITRLCASKATNRSRCC